MMDANTVAKTEEKKPSGILPMRVIVRGRLESMRRYEGKTYSHVMTPAADAYSRPQLVEIRSKSKLGEKGEEIIATCVLGGYSRKAYQAKDKATGEISTVVPVEHTLDLIED